ncbi:MAG: carbohydrate ABC transporter permease [Spirochaetales bacterium]|nr:carbohydrate ABC transporter permease [Spirochaetales bacterium]
MRYDYIKIVKKLNIGSSMIYIMLVAGAVFMIMPFLWMISSSLKDMESVFIFPPQWIPRKIILNNYKQLFSSSYYNFGRYYINTIIVVILRLSGMFVFCSMAAYGFARLEFPLKNIFFMIVLATLMLPIQVLMVPLYFEMRYFRWINTFRALVIPQALGCFGGAFSIFLLRQYFMALPKDLEDAAEIDGCNVPRTFYSIMLPQVKTAYAALAIFTFQGTWNDFVWPLIVINNPKKYVISLGISMFISDRAALTNWPLLMASSVLALIPIIVVFMFFQKYFMRNLVMSGIK